MTYVDVVRQTRVTIPDLPARIKAARLESGRNVQYLATAAGISTAYWYQIENGDRQWMSEETLRGIERALDMDFGIQFEG